MMENNETVTVLIIDDDPIILRVTRMILETHGYSVHEALNGINGLRLAKKFKPDIILLDIMMPDMDGYELCRELKLDNGCKDIPVLFVTAKTAPEHMRKGISLGASGYIIKPFSTENLINEIKNVLFSAKNGEPAPPEI